MTDKQPHPQRDGEQIAPAQVTLNAQPREPGASSEPHSVWRQFRGPAIGLGLSLAALLAVIFVLPEMVSPVTPAATESRASAAETKPAESRTGPTESPWRDAQFAKARRDAQDILQNMLEKQQALEAIRVDLWAGQDYQQAQALAADADQHYQSQEFLEAQNLYGQSLKSFEALLVRSESVFKQAVAAGKSAIAEGDAEAAHQQFELAAHIKPDDDAVKAGLQRAAVLDKVLAEVNAGERLQRQQQLDEARQRFQAALKLDAESALAKQRLAEVDQAIADRNFGQQMSTGFAAMEDNNYQRAIAAFEAALKIKPSAADAKSALEQARNENTHTRIQALLADARSQEQEEEWQAALDNYQQALKIDPNLVAARVGSIRTGTRAKIDKDMKSILAAPERLATPSVYRDYQAFYQEVSAIQNPGPKLSQQIAQLEEVLQRAIQPVTVQLKSDNATHVTLYRVGELGNFDQTELQLKPGTYTAVGTRKGYRDVRQEFTVSANAPLSPVVIQCVEKISQG